MPRPHGGRLPPVEVAAIGKLQLYWGSPGTSKRREDGSYVSGLAGPAGLSRSDSNRMSAIPTESPGTTVPGEFAVREAIAPPPSFLRRPHLACGWILASGVRIVCLAAFCALAAFVPLLNIWLLGYLLEVQGQIAAGAPLRRAFILAHFTTRLAATLLGMLLWLGPLYVIGTFAQRARLIDAESSAAIWLNYGFYALLGVAIPHLTLALLRGGSWLRFVRPLDNVRWLLDRLRHGQVGSHLRQCVGWLHAELLPGPRFWLGLRACLGTIVILALPATLFVYGSLSASGGHYGAVMHYVGAALFVFAMAVLPVTQIEMARQNHLAALFDVRAAVALFARGPLLITLALCGLYIAAAPPYTLKFLLGYPLEQAIWRRMELMTYIESPSFLAIAFVLGVVPARILLAGAVRQAASRSRSAWHVVTALCGIVLIAALAVYVGFPMRSLDVAEPGWWAVVEQRGLLPPFTW